MFVRTKIRCEQLYRRLRDRGMDVRALHGDMTQGARDGVMISFKDGRLPLLVATDVAARGLDISGVSHVINLRRARPRPTSTSTGSAAPPASAAAAARSRCSSRASERRSRRSRSTPACSLAPWVKDAHVAPTPVTPKPRRHSKPHCLANGDGPADKLIVSAGRAAGLEPSDIIHAITAATGLDGESVRNVRVLERFSFVEVPEREAERVVELVDGAEVRGQTAPGRAGPPSSPERSRTSARYAVAGACGRGRRRLCPASQPPAPANPHSAAACLNPGDSDQRLWHAR